MDEGQQRDDQPGSGKAARAWPPPPEADSVGWGAPAGVEPSGDRGAAAGTEQPGDPGAAAGTEPSRDDGRPGRAGWGPVGPTANLGWAREPSSWPGAHAGSEPTAVVPAVPYPPVSDNPPTQPYQAYPPGPRYDEADPGPATYGAQGAGAGGAWTESGGSWAGGYGAGAYPAGGYEAGTYQAGGYGAVGSHPAPYDQAGYPPRPYVEPPLFPTGPDGGAGPPVRRRRIWLVGGLIILVMALIGAGTAAAIRLNDNGTKTATSNPPPSTPTTPPSTARHPKTTAPGHVNPTTPPRTAAPTTVAPTTVAPTTIPPTTVAPTTVPPTTVPFEDLSTWTVEQLGLILQIKDDLTVLNQDLSGTPDFNALTADVTNLQSDERGVQSAPAPPDAQVAQEWSQLLSDLGGTNAALTTAIQTQDPNVISDVHDNVAATDTDYNTLSDTLDQDRGGGHGHASRNPGGQSSD